MEVHLVADTNLFFECKALEELEWAELGYDSIVILITKPVLDEIDKHKKAHGRTRKRAIEIFSHIRGMLNASTSDLVIREASPRVVLKRVPNVVPDETLSGSLDYTKNDDRLIGILATLSREKSGKIYKLFTDDTGPAATADGLGLPFKMINEEWRRPAEESTEDKKIRELEKDLATYRSQEPRISIGRCAPADDTGIVTVTRRIAQPLNETEIAETLETLQAKHPKKLDFSPPTGASADESGGNSATTIQFETPSDEDIKNYQDVHYPQWLKNCREILSNLHVGRDEIEGRVMLQWAMSNDGTRPASQVRVQFEAQGALVIRRPPKKNKATEGDDDDSHLGSPNRSMSKLPQPPKPPAFKKVITGVRSGSNSAGAGLKVSDLRKAGLLDNTLSGIAAAKTLGLVDFNPLADALKSFDQLGRASRMFEQGSGALFQPSSINEFSDKSISQISFRPPLVPQQHDPEAFYYDWSATDPVKEGALTCDLWRHQHNEQVFEFEVLFTKDGEARGSILCTVHAENLTKPETSRITIIRKVELFGLMELARAMVTQCG